MKTKNRKKTYPLLQGLLPFLLLIPSALIVFNQLSNFPSKHSEGVKVIEAIDGDTIILDGKSRVRLRHVDAPEKGLCGSSQATKELRMLTFGKKVSIEETIPDQYGRGMSLVYVGDILINEELLKSGWVRYHSDSSSQTKRLQTAQALARQEKRGIYGTCHSQENTKNPTCIIKGNIDKSTDTHIYYVPNCAQYPFAIVEEDIGEQWFCTEKQALSAGYIKAKTCEEK